MENLELLTEEKSKRAPESARLTSWTRALGPAAVLLALDRGFKALALALPIRASTGPIDFNLFRNQGIAFSLPLPDVVFWPLALIIFAALLVLFARESRRRSPAFAAYAVVIFGAASNLLDRALYGATVDYLIFFRHSAVNLADAMIVVGLALLLIYHRDHETPEG
ncbi:signal peptidase II [Candidatus Uhrbacteria bacterium]|nr:signal peptidase II [Candidatus Uhrbacteria bacterium]